MPSGTIWATCNIGANSPEEAGMYFAWGETQGYTAEQVGVDKNFDSDATDYKFGSYDSSDTTNYGMTKYNNTDGKKILDSEDDAATVNWGSNWKMPTEEQFVELIKNTYYDTTEVNGVYGLMLTSKIDEGKSLFFPDAGFAENGVVDKTNRFHSRYWSNSFYNYSNYDLQNLGQAISCEYDIEEGQFSNINTKRCIGCSVRPVRK